MLEEQYFKEYDKLWEISQKLRPYYGIDKVKPWAVFVYSEETNEDVFDILVNKLIFYNEYKEKDINKEAIPIIEEIQNQLKIIKRMRRLK